MRYQEYKPPIKLAPWIKLFWVFESRSNESAPETLVTDGFPELIIHFRSPFAEVDGDGQLLKQPAAVACGQLTNPLVLHRSTDAGMIGIRFQPGGMAPFLTTPMQLLTDARVPAEELFDHIDPFIEEIVESSNDAQRIAACHRFLIRSIDPVRETASVRRALQSIMHTRGSISVESLAALAGTSRRSLELAFQREIGTSPKIYCRIIRFRTLVDAVADDRASVNWARVALDCGFFDQSHMIRDFHQFTGESPTAFLAEQTSFAQAVNKV